MQKTLIIQVKVGNTPGYVYRPDQSPSALEASKLIEPVLVPTVERYCKKYNYDYKKITEYPEDLDITYFNKSTKPQSYDYSKGGKNKCSTLIRYLNMDLDYDRIVVLDNDIWIPEWAEELPEVLGHHGAVDLGKDYSAFHVIDVETIEQVAEYKGRMSTKDFGNMLVTISTEYNDALLIIENNNIGWATIQQVIDRDYPNLFYTSKDLQYVDVAHQMTNRYRSQEKNMVA